MRKEEEKLRGRGSLPYINQGIGDASDLKSCESPSRQSYKTESDCGIWRVTVSTPLQKLAVRN
eukprot:scaffold246029_cov21-Tisochrysis_lutea.AAC.1